MKSARPIIWGMLLATGHFLASLGIVPLTLKVGGLMGGGWGNSWLYGLLTLATKVLYFPILALALYPRHWFPGELITIPIAVNSLLWGIALALVVFIRRRWQTRS